MSPKALHFKTFYDKKIFLIERLWEGEQRTKLTCLVFGGDYSIHTVSSWDLMAL